ncbi:hypothetical protein PGB90_005634 [Kerria lacca]
MIFDASAATLRTLGDECSETFDSIDSMDAFRNGDAALAITSDVSGEERRTRLAPL